MSADDEPHQEPSSRESHLEWLRGQHAEYEAHQARGGPGPDLAVGGGHEADFALEDEAVPIYRSLSVMGPTHPSLEYEEEPVYRSIELGHMSLSDSLPSPDPVDAAWVAGKRPPLLRRQNAFAFQSEDPAWLDLLGQPEDLQSGH